MRLQLKHIAKIEEADIRLEGITVLAGENDTGKSTIGKALYSIFNSFWHAERSIQEVRISRIHDRIESILAGEYDLARVNFDPFWKCIEREKTRYLSKTHWQEMEQLLLRYAEIYSFGDSAQQASEIGRELVLRIIREIKDRLALSTKDILRGILQNYIDAEFHGQVNCLSVPDKDGLIKLVVRGKTVQIRCHDNKIDELSDILSLDTQVVYVDDPFVMDRLEFVSRIFGHGRRAIEHKQHLKRCLSNSENRNEAEVVVEEMVIDRRLQRVLKKLQAVCEGEIRLGHNSSFYVRNGFESVRVSNLSAGMKSFLVLKRLLQNGCLKEKGILILDEPEVHLHPAWQIIFAEVIVLLQKEYNMHILLATHSPYFLRAIEVFVDMHDISQQCRYYMATSHDGVANLQDVTSNTNLIYEKLLQPFEHLEGLGYA